MPASSKVDIGKMLEDHAAGLSPAQIAERQNVSRHAIEKRLSRHLVDPVESAKLDWRDRVTATFVKRSPSDNIERRVAALVAAEAGCTKRAAAAAAGISWDTLNRLLKSDADFEALWTQATGNLEATLINHWKQHTERDWRAAQAMLQNHPEMKERGWSTQNDENNGAITVILNIPPPRELRPDEKIISAEILDES